MGKRGPPTGEGGRPPTPIDIGLLRRSAGIGCTMEELSAVLGVPRRTLYDRMKQDPDIKDAIEEGRAQCCLTLRRLQWQAAEGGNVTMLIWLGKQYLGQRDRPVIDDDPDRPPSYVVYTAPIADTKEWQRTCAPEEALIDDSIIEVDD